MSVLTLLVSAVHMLTVTGWEDLNQKVLQVTCPHCAMPAAPQLRFADYYSLTGLLPPDGGTIHARGICSTATDHDIVFGKDLGSVGPHCKTSCRSSWRNFTATIDGEKFTGEAEHGDRFYFLSLHYVRVKDGAEAFLKTVDNDWQAEYCSKLNEKTACQGNKHCTWCQYATYSGPHGVDRKFNSASCFSHNHKLPRAEWACDVLGGPLLAI